MIPSAFVHEPLEEEGDPPEAPARPPRLRAIATVGALAAMQAAAFGLAWESVWHAYVGRERFFAPPAALIYGGLGVAGLLVFADVALETLRTRGLHPDDDTIAAFGARAPRGLLLAAGGMLTVAIAAPLDTAWHGWYGVDESLWAPFRVMALTGAAIVLLGLAYASAQLARRKRAFDFAVYLALAGGCGLSFELAEPALRTAVRIASPLATILPAPLICAIGFTFCTLAAVAYAGSSRAALAVLGFYLARTALFDVLVPLATHAAVAARGLIYRVPGFEPPLDAKLVLLSLTLAIPAAVVAFARERATTRAFAGVAALLIAVAASVWVEAAQSVIVPIPHADPPLGLDVVPLAVPFTSVLAALAGALLAAPARAFGRLLRTP